MSGLTVNVLLQDIKRLETEALIVGFFENERPLKNLAGELDWLLCGSLSNLIIKHKLRGMIGDIGLLTSRNKLPVNKIFMAGLGRKEGLEPAMLASASKTALTSAINAGVKQAAVECFSGSAMPLEKSIPALCSGFAAAAGNQPIAVTILAHDAASYEKMSRLVAANFGRGPANRTAV